MEPVSAAKDAARVVASTALATVARAGEALAHRADALRRRADLPSRADVTALTARLRALREAVDTL